MAIYNPKASSLKRLRRSVDGNMYKKALKKAIGSQVLSPFELYTYLLEVANLVNSRPIGRV